MKFLIFASFAVLSIAYGVTIKKLDDSSIHSPEHHELTKREASTSKGGVKNSARQKDFYEFVEDKLVQHSQALEHLVKLVNEAVNALQSLSENLGRNLEAPKLPERIDAAPEEKERSGDEAEVQHPIINFGRKLPQYGVFFKDLFGRLMENHSEPRHVVAKNLDS